MDSEFFGVVLGSQTSRGYINGWPTNCAVIWESLKSCAHYLKESPERLGSDSMSPKVSVFQRDFTSTEKLILVLVGMLAVMFIGREIYYAVNSGRRKPRRRRRAK